MPLYWDTSAILKVYIREADSDAYIRRVADSPDPLVSSALLSSELVYAFHQKEFRGEIASGMATAIHSRYWADVMAGRFLLLPVGEDVRTETKRVASLCYSVEPAICLRTLDGLHLASAILAGCSEILTTDKRMCVAAERLGLSVASVS